MVTKQRNLMQNKIQKSYNLLYFFSFLSNLKKTAIIIFKQASACNEWNTDIFFQKTVVKSYPTYFLKKNSYKTQCVIYCRITYLFTIHFSFFVIASLTADLDFQFILIFFTITPNLCYCHFFLVEWPKKSILASLTVTALESSKS